MHGSAFHALAKDTGKKILVEGKGIMVKDIDGGEYIDALAGLWLVNVGHGRQEIGDAMARQAGTLAYASSTQATTIPAIELATRERLHSNRACRHGGPPVDTDYESCARAVAVRVLP